MIADVSPSESTLAALALRPGGAGRRHRHWSGLYASRGDPP